MRPDCGYRDSSITHRLATHLVCCAALTFTTTLLLAQPMPPVASMPAKLTSCTAIARAAAPENVSLNILEQRMSSRRPSAAIDTRVGALLQECNGVFLTDLPRMIVPPCPAPK